MIVTTIVINSDTSEDTVSAIEALTKKLRERGLAENAPLGQKTPSSPTTQLLCIR